MWDSTCGAKIRNKRYLADSKSVSRSVAQIIVAISLVIAIVQIVRGKGDLTGELNPDRRYPYEVVLAPVLDGYPLDTKRRSLSVQRTINDKAMIHSTNRSDIWIHSRTVQRVLPVVHQRDHRRLRRPALTQGHTIGTNRIRKSPDTSQKLHVHRDKSSERSGDYVKPLSYEASSPDSGRYLHSPHS